jgi:hypothetical protein
MKDIVFIILSLSLLALSWRALFSLKTTACIDWLCLSVYCGLRFKITGI